MAEALHPEDKKLSVLLLNGSPHVKGCTAAALAECAAAYGCKLDED